jgi:mannose-6-phosphate isomerase-like protein (cupin superfamily)
MKQSRQQSQSTTGETRMKMPKALSFAGGIITGVLLTASLTAVWVGLAAQGGPKSTSKVVLENDRVRVKEAIFAPGDTGAKMHTHEYPHVGVIIDGGTLRFNYPDGKTETMELPRGGVGYREANVTHQAINPGKEPVRVIEVEIK